MKLGLSLSQKGLLVVSLILVVELAFVGALMALLNDANKQLRREQHVQAVIYHLNRESNLWQRLTIESMRFVITKNPELTQHQREIIDGCNGEFATLHDLLRDEPEQLAVANKLKKTLDYALAVLEECRASYFARNNMLHMQLTAKLHSISDGSTEVSDRLLDNFIQIEKEEREKHLVLAERVSTCLIAGLSANVILCVVLALLFTRGITRRLGVIAENTSRLAAGKPLQSTLEGQDELARVDQTFHKMARELTLARQRERAVIENANDVICTIDSDEKFQAVNAAAQANWGYAADDLLGRRFAGLLVEADREKARAALAALAKSGEATSLENRVVKKDGTIADVLWSVTWSEDERAFFCVAHDITARKKEEALLKASEERVRSVIENLPVGVVTSDGAGKIESINPCMARMCNYSPEQVIGRTISSLFAGSRAQQFFESLPQTETKSGNNGHGKPIHLDGVRAGGGEYPVEVSVQKYQTGAGPRYLINVQDITERRQIENKKQEFVAMVSHDLRTPLTSIGAALSLIEAGRLDLQASDGLGRVRAARENVNRLMTLVNDLLDMEKLESGTLQIDKDCVDLSYIIEKSREAVRGVAEQNGIGVTMPSTNLQVIADRDRCIQVLINILSNAVKFSPPGSTVEITAVSAGPFAEVRVRDSGKGVPPEYQQSIFERFKQVESADGKRGAGTGLGLAICKAIVEAHGGQIGLESAAGKGSVFWFRIPLADADLI